MTTARLTVVQNDMRTGEPELRVDVDVPVELLQGMEPEAVAEAVYMAVDEPQMFDRADGSLTSTVAAAVRPRRELAQVGDMRGFMTGDTVELGDTRLRCAAFGWGRY